VCNILMFFQKYNFSNENIYGIIFQGGIYVRI
jgi:hypothetical protein